VALRIDVGALSKMSFAEDVQLQIFPISVPPPSN
jgi:hypothetical protein